MPSKIRKAGGARQRTYPVSDRDAKQAARLRNRLEQNKAKSSPPADLLRKTGTKIKTAISEMPTSYVMRELDRIKEKRRTGPTVTEDPQPVTPGTEGDWRKGKRDSDIRDRYDSMAEDIAAGNSSISDIKDAFDKRQVRKRLQSIASDVDIDTRSRRR